MTKPRELQNAVLGYLEDLEVEQTAAYARGGRLFSKLTDDELVEAWFDAMQAYASDPTSSETRMVEFDVRAELVLRGLEPPWGFVSVALSEIRAKVGKLFEHLDRSRLVEIEEQLKTNIANYLSRRDRPHH